MDKAVSEFVEGQLRSVFPEGTLTQVNVLGYGDDPDVEPGETAIRAFVDRAGHPAGSIQDDEHVLRAFERVSRPGIGKLADDNLLPAVAWVQFIPDTPARRAPGAVLWGFPSMNFTLRPDMTDEVQGFTSVQTRLGPDDLATVDALIAARVAYSRAEVLRWAIGRIRENPVYAQIQEPDNPATS